MSARCSPAYQARAITQALDRGNINASIASFLITRPPFAWLGYGWESDMKCVLPLLVLHSPATAALVTNPEVPSTALHTLTFAHTPALLPPLGPRDWTPEFMWQVGTPEGGCTDEGNGVFSRQWTAGKVSLNCSSYASIIPTL